MENRAEISRLHRTEQMPVKAIARRYRHRYLNIQRLSYLATFRQGFEGITGNLVT